MHRFHFRSLLYVLLHYNTLTSAELITVTTHRSACSTTAAAATCSPTHFADDCGFDARRDAAIGFVDLADPMIRGKYYTTKSDEWLEDDMPYLGLAKAGEKRWSISGAWDDVSNFVSDNAETAAKWAGSLVVSQVAKQIAIGAAKGVWNGVKNVYTLATNLPNDAATAVEDPRQWFTNTMDDIGDGVNDLKTIAENPGEALSNLGTTIETNGVEGVTEALFTGAVEVGADARKRKLKRRGGTNCTAGDCNGAVFNTFNTYDALATLWHATDGNIYSFSDSKLHEIPDTASTFSGIKYHIFGDSRGRILHGYRDEMEAHNVSRLRLSDINAVPKTAIPLQLIPVKHPSGGHSRVVAVDTEGNGYHLITCAYTNTLPKVFVGSHFVNGPAALTDESVSDIVQALEPKWCATIPYTNGGDGV